MTKLVNNMGAYENKIEMEKWEITTDKTEMFQMIKEICEKIYANIYENLDR